MRENLKSPVPSLLAGGLIWIMIVGFVAVQVWAWRNWQTARLLRRDGVETPAQVIELELYDLVGAGGYCAVTFTYVADGAIWQEETRVGADFCQTYSVGSAATARYWPANPDLANLIWGGYLEVELFAALFLDGALLLAAVIIWRRSRRGAESAAAPVDIPIPSPISPAKPAPPPDGETAVTEFQAIWARAQAIPEDEFFRHFESLRDEALALGEPAMAAVLQEARRDPPGHLLEWLVYLLSDRTYRPALPDYIRWLEHENDEVCFAAAVTVDNMANGRFGLQELIAEGWAPYDQIRARAPAMQQWGREQLADGMGG